jgi:Mg/Co/Ni transporter MgtE
MSNLNLNNGDHQPFLKNGAAPKSHTSRICKSMENKKLEEFLDVLDSCTESAFNQKNIQSDIYRILNEIKDFAVWDMLRLASSVSLISFSVGESGEEIARNIADRAIEKAVREKNVDDLITIADELEMSLEFDDLAEEVREIISKMS